MDKSWADFNLPDSPHTIAILAPSPVPFQNGGAEKFWWGLRRALAQTTNAYVEIIKLPAPEGNFAQVISSYELFSKLNLDHFDMVITSKYPAWMCAHRNHVCYMLHRLRGVYDFYYTSFQTTKVKNPGGHLTDLLQLLDKPLVSRKDLEPAFELIYRALEDRIIPSSIFALPGPLIRRIVHFFDRIALNTHEIKAWLSISRTVAERPDYFPPNVPIKILYPPSDLRDFSCKPGEYFFTASRMSVEKRIDLLIEAMKYFPMDIPLKIAGTGAELERYRRLAESDRRIHFLGYVSDKEMPGLYSHAIAVPFVPNKEDYGLISLEAMKSGKPIITASDSGGACELVENGKTGLIVRPTPKALARAMLKLAQNRQLARQMGFLAAESVAAIGWRQTALGLLEHANLGSFGEDNGTGMTLQKKIRAARAKPQ